MCFFLSFAFACFFFNGCFGFLSDIVIASFPHIHMSNLFPLLCLRYSTVFWQCQPCLLIILCFFCEYDKFTHFNANGDTSLTVVAVFIEINIERITHKQGGRSFRPVVSGDRRGNFSRESFRQISGTGNAEILLRWIRVFILHHHNKVLILRVFHDGSINDAEIGVEKHFGLREGLEIFRGYVVHAMVQAFLEDQNVFQPPISASLMLPS